MYVFGSISSCLRSPVYPSSISESAWIAIGIIENLAQRAIGFILLLRHYNANIARSFTAREVETWSIIIVFCLSVPRISVIRSSPFLNTYVVLAEIRGSVVDHAMYPLGRMLASRYVLTKMDRIPAFHGRPSAHFPMMLGATEEFAA